MRALMVLGLAGLAACIEPAPLPADGGLPDAAVDALPPPTSNRARGIDDTSLAIDLSARTGIAVITFEPSRDAGATLEVGDLALDSITLDGGAVPFAVAKDRVDLGLPASRSPMSVELRYRWTTHEGFSGVSMQGYTLTWPYHCGNVFPCHSDPADGTTFSLALTGVPAGSVAVFPARIPSPAPAYQVAWTVGAYTELPLGTTDAGTQLVAWIRPGEEQDVRAGTAPLVRAFGWFEQTLGPYRFGPKAGPVTANWGAVVGGMEHHPYWHMGRLALPNADIQVHEAAHGWFGDGVRLACWEDLVLSEGTAQYLSARALEVVDPPLGMQSWQANTRELMGLSPTALVWPEGCGQIDVLAGLFTRAPYIRGAFFLRAVALRVGAPALDLALSAFYGARAGEAATLEQLLEVIRVVTGFDAHDCARKWLRSTTIPAPGACD